MYIKKKTAFIITLVCILIVICYVNHELTKRSLMEASIDYQEYEKNQLMELSKSIDIKEEDITYEENSVDDIVVLDSKSDDIGELKRSTDEDILSVMTNEKNLKNNNYFIEHRLSRDKLRATLIDRLYEIINNEKTNEEMRIKAQNEIISIGQIAELELSLEGLIKAKGFEDALVFLSENSARVVVSTDELTEQDVIKIFEIITSETDIDAENIKIMEKF